MSRLSLLDNNDLDWVADIVDIVETTAGQPWRVALDRLTEGPWASPAGDTGRSDHARAPVRFKAVVTAVQRVLGGRTRNARRARMARSLVLGKPVLDTTDRDARLAAAATELEITSAAVEMLLWADLPRERPVELLRGRPSEFEVAANANLSLMQRAMMRAQTVTLRIWGDAAPLIHAAAARGLLTTLARGPRGETVVHIIGPLGLFHRTAVYGRALSTLVPLLADCEQFEIELLSRGRERMYTVEVSSPVLLPPVPARLALPDFNLMRLAKELQRIAKDITVTLRPPAIESGDSLLCPDLRLEHAGRTAFVELIGFWTGDYVVNKLAAYREAGITGVVFCVDAARACTKDPLPDALPIVPMTKQLTAAAHQLADHMRAA